MRKRPRSSVLWPRLVVQAGCLRLAARLRPSGMHAPVSVIPALVGGCPLALAREGEARRPEGPS